MTGYTGDTVVNCRGTARGVVPDTQEVSGLRGTSGAESAMEP